MSAFVDGVGIASGVIAVALGVGTLYGGLRFRWRRTVGSRRNLTRRLNQLTVGMPAENLPGLLGPCRLRRDAGDDVGHAISEDDRGMGDLRQEVYLSKHACIDALIEPDRNTVAAFSVTVSDPRFQFELGRLSFGLLNGVRLGQTVFGSPKVPRDPDEAKWWNGARFVGWAEAHWGANPAGYQSYVLAYLQTGVGHLAYDLVPEAYEGGLSTGRYVELPAPWNDFAPVADDYIEADWARFRAKSTINTLQVIGPSWSGTLSFPGVHGDVTRLIRQPPQTLRQRLRELLHDTHAV